MLTTRATLKTADEKKGDQQISWGFHAKFSGHLNLLDAIMIPVTLLTSKPSLRVTCLEDRLNYYP